MVWQIREKRGGGIKGNHLRMKKLIHWSRLKWDDGCKVEFEKIYITVKNIVEKNQIKIFLIEIKSKNEVFLFLHSRKRKETKKRKKKKEKRKLKIWKGEYTELD